jgi:hypothetical protein
MTKPRKPGRTEKEVTQQVLDAAAMLGVELKRRNVGAVVNPLGQTVRFGEKGDADWYAVLPDGRHLDVEIKRECFDPTKLRGAKKAHFERQLARLRRTNELGGVGFWISDAVDFLAALRKVLDGARVEIDERGFPWVNDDKV